MPLPSPHAPLFLEKDDLRARTACTACAAFPYAASTAAPQDAHLSAEDLAAMYSMLSDAFDSKAFDRTPPRN